MHAVFKFCSRNHIFAKSVRKAGAYKRSPVFKVQRDQLEELKVNIFNNRNELSLDEWQETQQLLIANNKHISNNNIDAVIIGLLNQGHQLPLAKNYLKYLKHTNVEPNAATLGRLLRVYNAAYHERGGTSDALTAAEKQQIIEIYTNLRKKHEVFDVTLAENLIHGLVCTEQWKDSKELLEMMKLTTAPTIAAYTEIVLKAFNVGDIEFGWQILEEMITMGKIPRCEVFIALLQQISQNVDKNFSYEFERLLSFIGKHEILITEKIVNHIEILAKKAFFTVSRTELSTAAKCKICNNRLENISVSDVDFAKLSNSFLNKVLVRNDVFQKSTPEEVERFKKFIAETAPYDCVIDGLNVAYSTGANKPPATLINLLINAVKYFSSKKKHVLVLGRKHMLNWSKSSWQNIYKNASVFLTNNLSSDDPFLLYATLRSGSHTDFFSRDLMRSHAFLLGPELRPIFKRWQQEHQYSLVTQTSSGKIIVKEPIRHLICAHKVKETWHLPYKQEYCSVPPDTFEVPQSWLCIKLQN